MVEPDLKTANERIEREKTGVLDLRDLGLTEIPPAFFEGGWFRNLRHLRELRLGDDMLGHGVGAVDGSTALPGLGGSGHEQVVARVSVVNGHSVR